MISFTQHDVSILYPASVQIQFTTTCDGATGPARQVKARFVFTGYSRTGPIFHIVFTAFTLESASQDDKGGCGDASARNDKRRYRLRLFFLAGLYIAEGKGFVSRKNAGR